MEKDQQAEQRTQTAQNTPGDGPAAGREQGEAAVPGAEAENQSHVELTQLLEDARSKADDHWDQLMRTRAEIENLKRRHEREVANAHKFALDNFVRELLQVWDSLELGLSAAREEQADIDKLREGSELTLKLFEDAMRKFGVEQVDPAGQPFDPALHQAMTIQPRADVAPDTVVNVLQKGYTLNGRLVRPALVIVSQAVSGGVDEQA